MIHWWHRRRIDRYFAGRLDARGEAEMRGVLGRCAACRRHYQLHLVAEAATPAAGDPALDRLWRGIARAAGRPQESTTSPRRPARWTLAAVVAAAAAWLVIVRPYRVADPVPRGAADAASGPVLHIFRPRSASTAQPISDGRIRTGDGLLFAYTNPDGAFTHLMVFAVDESYAVHWYYPAYEHAGDDPQAVPIVQTSEGVELREEIKHALRPGSVRLHALFLREPHRVLEIEAMIRDVVERPRRRIHEDVRLPIPGSILRSELLTVEP